MRILTKALLVATVLGSTGIAGCASTSGEEAEAAAQKKSDAAGQQTAGEVVDDSVVTAKVKAKLVDDPVTKAYQINVETFKGTVQLSGFVDTAEQKTRAEQLAASVSGVMAVKNNITLKTAANP